MTVATCYLVILILTLHWLADFVLQTSWQATNKSTNNFALAKHVGTYTATLVGVAVFASPFSVVVAWAVVNGVLHFITDYVTSRITSYLWSKGDVHNFFVVVGLDQLIHYICLFGTLVWLLDGK